MITCQQATVLTTAAYNNLIELHSNSFAASQVALFRGGFPLFQYRSVSPAFCINSMLQPASFVENSFSDSGLPGTTDGTDSVAYSYFAVELRNTLRPKVRLNSLTDFFRFSAWCVPWLSRTLPHVVRSCCPSTFRTNS